MGSPTSSLTAIGACQRSSGNRVGRLGDLQAGGHQFSRLVAASSCRRAGLGGQGDHPLSGEGFGEPVGVAFGQDEVGVVQEPVHGGGGQGFRHDGVEPGGVDVAGHGGGAAFVGGVGDAVERFGGVLPGGQHPDVVDDDQVAAADPGDGAGDRSVCFGAADRGGEGLQGVPGHAQVFLDRGVGQGLDEV